MAVQAPLVAAFYMAGWLGRRRRRRGPGAPEPGGGAIFGGPGSGPFPFSTGGVAALMSGRSRSLPCVITVFMGGGTGRLGSRGENVCTAYRLGTIGGQAA